MSRSTSAEQSGAGTTFISSLLTLQRCRYCREHSFGDLKNVCQGTKCSEGRHCMSGECVPATPRQESTTSSPSPTTSRPPDQSNNSPYQIIYKMKVCDFFKLLSPNNYPSFCDS